MSIKPLGSERLDGIEKLQRIMEIARFKENIPTTTNETSKSDYKITLSDGNEYQIIKEKVGYIIKKTISESETDYIEPMKNRKYYPSYSQALKRLNLMAKEMNTLYQNESGMSLFSEQKKFVLKTPEKKNPEPTTDVENIPPPPAPAGPEAGGEMPPPPPPAEGGEDMGGDMSPSPEGEEMGGDMSPSPEGEEMGGPEEHEGAVTFKTIQKLTGKLGQKLRQLGSDEENKMSSKDVKYVINSILSALDLNSLEDEDKEEILSKFDGEEGEDMGGEDMGSEDMGGEESPEETPSEPSPEGEDEMGEGEMSEETSPWVDFAKTGALKSMSKMMEPGSFSKNEAEMMETDESDDDTKHIRRIADEMFVENKVENILSNYFVVSESEKKFNFEVKKTRKKINNNKYIETIKAIDRLSESKEQNEKALKFFQKNQNWNFIGRTNKKNLMFENGNKQIKISSSGTLL